MSVVRRESVSHASRMVVFCGAECVVVGEDMRLCMCGCVCVLVYVWVLIKKNNMPALLAFLGMNKTNSHRWRIVFGGLPALRMAQGPQRRSLAVSGARLRGWLAWISDTLGLDDTIYRTVKGSSG